MKTTDINAKISDLEEEEKRLATYTRELEILQKYTGEDRMVSAQELFNEVSEENKTKKSFYTTLSEFDRLVGGFREGQVVVISAPTGQGKTTFCQTLTVKFAEQQINCGWFSYEVGVEEFLTKFPEVPLCYMPRRIKQNSLKWLEARIKEGIAKYNCKVFFIDHLHYLLEMQRMAEAKSISLLVGMMMRELKKIAIENDVIIFLVSHMRKSLYKTDTSTDLPDIDDLRDSSFVGQESDMVLFLYRKTSKDMYGNKFFTNETLLKIAKNRRTGNLGCVKLIFSDKQFSELELNHTQNDNRRSEEVGFNGLDQPEND